MDVTDTLARVIEQLKALTMREVQNWAFGVALAAMVGHGRLVIDFQDGKITRLELNLSIKPGDVK